MTGKMAGAETADYATKHYYTSKLTGLLASRKLQCSRETVIILLIAVEGNGTIM